MNPKTLALAAAAVALLVLIVGHKSSGQSYHSSVKEYDCHVAIADDPRPLNNQVLAGVKFSCSAPPRTTELTVFLQYRPKDSLPWEKAAPDKAFTGTPTAQDEIMNDTQACKAGQWRVGYEFAGTGAGTGKPFTTDQAWGSAQSISAEQCANS